MRKTILYSGWVGFGNQGDDLCYDIFKRSMGLKAKAHGISLEIKGIFPDSFNEFALSRINPDLVVLGAGSLFEPIYLKPLVLAQQNRIPTAIWGSGFDSLFPEPLEASLIDPDSAFIIRQVVQRADQIGIRGPYTMNMLQTIGAVNPGLEIVGDPGLLLTKQNEAITLGEINKVKKPIIAVNWGSAANKVLGGSERAMAQSLAKVLAQLTTNYTIVIYPLWSQDIAPCRALYDLINQPGSTLLLHRVPTADELIDLYRKSTLSINMKLHASVFSAATNCPFITLAYRMKGYDFAKSLDWENFVFLFSDNQLEAKVSSAVLELTDNIENYTIKLKNKKDEYHSKLSSFGDQMIALLQAEGEIR